MEGRTSLIIKKDQLMHSTMSVWFVDQLINILDPEFMLVICHGFVFVTCRSIFLVV